MSQATRIFLSLILGLAIGIAATAANPQAAVSAAGWVEPVGIAWLNALRMTIVPLVVALVVTGIAATAEAARAGRVAGRAIALFLVVLWTSSAIGAVVTLGLLDLWPLADSSAQALRNTFQGAAPVGEVPSFGQFLGSIVPSNPISAAATDSFLPLIVFTCVFGFAITRLPDGQRRTLTGFFEALRDAMLVIIGWVLWIAPLGVAALGYAVAAHAGTAALGALVHYVVVVSAVGVVVWVLAYPVAWIGGGVAPPRFFRAIIPAQAVAISTQSSLASLPAMLGGAERLGIPVATSGLVLPLAVALFRATGPCMNLAVAIYVAHVFGITPGPAQLAAGIAAAAITTMGAVSLPGQVSFVSSIAPIALAMGVPIEPLALLVAVEMLPDLVRTLGNVTMDVAATSVIARHSGPPPEKTAADSLLGG
ncbi:dicarboxylate/amino acid:cation symporter [Sphingomonas canadensis]|uniref:Dicarboxylate/amino acid:cation symporter n=1 Tax=Sphingomonas canadensis TaxID=1219257 RepID=A0ABW3H6F2_9SPHN|nr:dicarboxylate/amino acid:cation symporter [Sphingomonas canadensis]MCW3835113.1 dicarboxylate/amino acid:cation symporter [Sphingomonas canadensis]